MGDMGCDELVTGDTVTLLAEPCLGSTRLVGMGNARRAPDIPRFRSPTYVPSEPLTPGQARSDGNSPLQWRVGEAGHVQAHSSKTSSGDVFLCEKRYDCQVKVV